MREYLTYNMAQSRRKGDVSGQMRNHRGVAARGVCGTHLVIGFQGVGNKTIGLVKRGGHRPSI